MAYRTEVSGNFAVRPDTENRIGFNGEIFVKFFSGILVYQAIKRTMLLDYLVDVTKGKYKAENQV